MSLSVEHIPCPLCGESKYTVIYPYIDRIDTPDTRVVRCTHCGLVYLNPRLKRFSENFTLSEAYLREFYLPDQQRIGRLTPDGGIDHEKNRSFHARPLEQMKPYRMNNRVLDVGCAIGLFLAAAQRDGWESFGIEPSRPLSDYGRHRFGINIYQGELHERAFPDGYFDVVTLWEVVEHLMHPLNVLREVYRVLRPGGLLLLSTPNWHDIAREILGARWNNFVTDHFQFFTQATIRQALRWAGFTAIRTSTERLSFQGTTNEPGQQVARNIQHQLTPTRHADRGSTLMAVAEKPQPLIPPSVSPDHRARPRPVVYLASGSNVGTTFEYRVLHKQEQLAHCGIKSIVRQYLPRQEVTFEEALSCSVLYLYRIPFDPFIEDLIARARARGIPVVFDADDLIFEPEIAYRVDNLKTMSHDEAALYYEGVWRYRRTLLACDCAVLATDYLAERARALGKPAFVHRNALGEVLMQAAEPLYAQRQISPSSSQQIIVGYGSGTDTHRRDFAEVADAMATILTRHTSIELRIVGPITLPESLSPFKERIKSLPRVSWHEWPAILHSFDINLAPLEPDNPFSRGKSEVKYIEAAILGIPTLASRIDAFEFAIRDGENGFLAGDTDEWVEKLERLLADPALRHQMGEAARADVLARYTPSVRGRELVETLETIQSRHVRQPTSNAPTGLPNPAESGGPGDPPRALASKPLILNWVFTEPIPGSGGHADIIRMMNLLADFGHRINIYMVPFARLSDKSDLEIREFVRRHFADLHGHLFKWTGGPMVESDATILTYWETAYMLGGRVDVSKVFYFVQDWEPFFYPMNTQYLRAEQTYKMGFSCITLGRWLTQLLRERYGADADYFDLAVDHTIYYPRLVNKPDHPRICFYARPSTPRRLFPLGIAALDLVYRRRTDVELVFYGAAGSDLTEHAIPFPYVNRGILSEDELAELFSTSHVGLALSSTNCSLVPPEMMACKCAVVDLNRETVQGVLEHEVNALLAEPTPEAIAEAIWRLLDDEMLRQRLVETAYRQMLDRPWEKSARKVETILYGKLPESKRMLVHGRVVPRPPLPAGDDLPAGQRERLSAIHEQRHQAGALARAIGKRWIKRLLRIEPESLLDGKAIHTLGELTGKSCIGQSFVALHSHLCRIDILTATYGRRNTRDVIFHLRASPTATEDLATARINAALIADNSYVSFVFEPQPDSQGRLYYFCAESPESLPGDAITAWACHRVDLADAALYHNHLKRNGQLVFGAYYRDDYFGEVGERPMLHAWRRSTTFGDRLVKAYRVYSSQGIDGLWREVKNYWKWRTGKA